MKKVASILLAALITVFSAVSVSAEPGYGGLNEFNKSSRSDFEGKGGLTRSVQVLESFETLDNTHYKYDPLVKLDTSNKKQGNSSISMTVNDGDVGDYSSTDGLARHRVFETTSPNFHFDIDDVHKYTVGMWFYIDNVDNLPCDHDFVYDHTQKNCGTIYFSIGASSGDYFNWNHTFEGNGWHYIEFDFSSRENVSADTREFISLEDLKYMRLTVNGGGMPYTINVDEISLISYETSTPTPECPNNGRWISTCDYDVLDGATVTEWIGAYFDENNKTQGSSSVTVRGKKEHVDYREVLCGYSIPVDINNDVFCCDVYVENAKLTSSDWTISFYSMDESKSTQINYNMFHSGTVTNGGLFKNGWNTIQVPFSVMNKQNGSSQDNEPFDEFTIARIKIFCAGASEDEYYTIAYDNMYIANKNDIDNSGIADAKPDKLVDTLKQNNEKNDGEENEGESNTALIIAIAAVCAAVVIVVVFLVVAIAVKKKRTAAKPQPAKTKTKKDTGDKKQ